MITIDLFDTLLGRWYYYPDSIFKEMEVTLNLDNFTWARKHAENISKVKNLFGIYSTLYSFTNYDIPLEVLLNLELDFEKKRTFPILENVEKFLIEEKAVIVSDTYYTKEQVIELLSHHNITVENDVYCSYDGKQTGSIWKILKPDLHIGDNEHSDCKSPLSHGINVKFYEDSKLNEFEKFLYSNNYKQLAFLMRMLRLSNPYYDDQDLTLLWEEQTQNSIPANILLSNYIYSLYKEHQFKKILFTYRDCYYLYNIFTSLYKNVPCDLFYISRDSLNKNFEGVVKYVDSVLEDDVLVVDMQGTGLTLSSFLERNDIKKKITLFTVVDSLLENKKLNFNKINLFSRRNGYTDVLERVNYVTSGKVLDIINNFPVFDTKVSNLFIKSIEYANKQAVTALRNGFAVEKDYIYSILKIFVDNIEHNCQISKFVNHDKV